MGFTESEFTFHFRIGKILFILLIFWSSSYAKSLFLPGKEYVYLYNATTNSGALAAPDSASIWGFYGKLVIHANENLLTLQFRDLKMSLWNGKIEEQRNEINIGSDIEELNKPFQAIINKGLIENFRISAESTWSANIKRSIVGILQLDLNRMEDSIAFHSTEINHYGQCDVDYIVHSSGGKQLVHKFINPQKCIGHPRRAWTNIPRILCNNNAPSSNIKSSERFYTLKIDELVHDILSIDAKGEIYVQPFQSNEQAHYLFARQYFELISKKNIMEEIEIIDLHSALLKHELPESEMTQGRNTPDKISIFKSIENLLDRLSQRLETPGLDSEVNNLHNTTISVLLYYLEMLDHADLQTAYNRISGTSYKQETIRNLFLETLPQIGTRPAMLFVLDLIQRGKVSDISAIQLLTHVPFNIKKPDVDLLVGLQPLLQLPDKTPSDVQNTAILAFGTLIYKTCLISCPPDILDDYVRLFLDKFTENEQYEKKMVWLQGLANIQLGRVIEFLEPIASGNSTDSEYFRTSAAWASLPTAALRPETVYSIYWPILVNKTEYLEMRIAALNLLIVSEPSPQRLITLYWYIQTETNAHLYNYFYTTLISVERTTYPCYLHLGRLATQFLKILRKPASDYLITTGNYLVDYRDVHRKFGGMLQSIVIANQLTNIPEAVYFTYNNYGRDIVFHNVALYVKGKNLLQSLPSNVESLAELRDILKQFKFDRRKKEPAYLEIIARVQEKTILCLHINESRILKALEQTSFLSDNLYRIYHNLEFHINQQRINVPLSLESVEVTDLGTNVRLAVKITSLVSLRGNFTCAPFAGRNNNAILRTSIHESEVIETYNPLVDVWQGVEKARSLHGYLPINITMGLHEKPFISYKTPTEYAKAGIIIHARTVTNIRGTQVKSKLKPICPKCSTLHTISKNSQEEYKDLNIFQLEVPELGGQMNVKMFDCDNSIFDKRIITDILSSHQANYKIWSPVRFPLIGFHLFDYLTYLPYKGSCGLAAYMESFDVHSEVKLEYVKNSNHHVISLTHQDLVTLRILQQWNVALLYEETSWISRSLKLKATRSEIGKPITKICIEAENEIPWEWEYLRDKPIQPATIRLDISWSQSNTAKGKCTGSSVHLNLLGEISSDQISESKKDIWPYAQCRKASKGLIHIPFTDACYLVSKELSTYRKYTITMHHTDLSENLLNSIWKLQQFYNLIKGIKNVSTVPDKFAIIATFPKDSDIGYLKINDIKLNIEYNYDLIDLFLVRTRIHHYFDNYLTHSFTSACVVTRNTVKTVYNKTIKFEDQYENLLLGSCNEDDPAFAVTIKHLQQGFEVNFYDKTGILKIIPQVTGGRVYNYTMHIPLEPDFKFYNLENKSIRLDDQSVDIMFPNKLLFMHWSQDQNLLFFPNYFLQYNCGLCTSNDDVDYRFQRT
ncbi:vitellogenin-5 [Prorops nasuta]|uniref:vitellogenin-5 n=1 Tax=Prorops nasuta TaxID=863751 RepID=UPI0034CDDFB9